MPWNKRTLAIPAIPPSVRLARRWVSDVLEEVGRGDLVDSACLGVSELVTNALLHADPPVTIRVRGTVDHPRVEVTDQSLSPPRRIPHEEPEEYVATYGRGLDLVASHATKWGSDINFHGTGKTVWFEPAPGPHPADEADAIVFTPDDVEEPADLAQQDRRLTVRFLGMPPALFLHLRNHFYDLHRELRLLDLSEPGDHPLAAQLVELFHRVESERRRAVGTDRLDEAMDLGVDTVDLEYQVPVSAPETMRRFGELMEQLYAAENRDLLLTAKPPEDVIALQRWYLDQFVRQGHGAEPSRWAGPTTLNLPPR